MNSDWRKRLSKIGRIVLAVALGLGGLVYVIAPHPPKVPKRVANLAELEAFLARLVESNSPPSISVAVVKDGALVYERAFGLADGPRQMAATPQTVYHWWSMTKIVTAIAILQLHEQGRIHLDAPVTTYLPDFVVQDAVAANPPITIRQLLNHSSGLPDIVPDMLGWVRYEDDILDQTHLLSRRLPQYNRLQFVPGSKAIYSNLGYMVLGAVIEAVSGQPYSTYVTEHILRPLGMTQTGFIYTPSMRSMAAVGTQPIAHPITPLLPFLLDTRALIRERAERTLWFNPVYIETLPPSGLIGPAHDVARLMMAYLQRGALEGIQILQPQSVALMSSQNQVLGEGPNMADYRGGLHGLGWYVIPEAGRMRLQHHGGGPGFATTMRLYPAEQFGIVIMANGTDLDRDGLADLLSQMDWARVASR